MKYRGTRVVQSLKQLTLAACSGCYLKGGEIKPGQRLHTQQRICLKIRSLCPCPNMRSHMCVLASSHSLMRARVRSLSPINK